MGGWAALFVPTQGLAVKMIWSTYLRMGKGFVFINLKIKMATAMHAVPAKHPLGFACPQNLADARAWDGGSIIIIGSNRCKSKEKGNIVDKQSHDVAATDGGLTSRILLSRHRTPHPS